MKLRLLITEKCNRSCDGCCNKDWDLKSLPIIDSFSEYSEVMITGGEPMLMPELIIDTVTQIRRENILAPIYVYTAKVDELWQAAYILSITNGLTVTLHEQKDVVPFMAFQSIIKDYINFKSMRLNVFKGIDIQYVDTTGWKVKKNITWIKNCPLPNGEVIGRINKL